MMTSDSIERHVTPADGNIFADLGFPPGEAKTLIIRSTLMVTAKQVLEERELTPAEAAKLMGVSRRQISNLIRGRINEFTIESLISMLTNAGVPVEVRAAGNAA